MHFINDPTDNISTLVSSFMFLNCCLVALAKKYYFLLFYSLKTVTHGVRSLHRGLTSLTAAYTTEVFPGCASETP